MLPNPTSTAPAIPPTRQCEELDGIPKYQVTKFQIIAAKSPMSTISNVTTWGTTIPLQTVAAMFVERRAPTKLSTAAKTKATVGGIARVEIEVPMAFAAS